MAVAAAACGGDDPEAGVARPQTVDSAGIRIVELGADPEQFTERFVATSPLFRFGVEGSGVELFRVSDAGFPPNGHLAIGSSGVPEVLVFGPDGGLIDRLGDRGEGPGQFGAITSVHPQPDGAIVVYDDTQRRMTSFDPTSQVATRRMTDASTISDLIDVAASQQGPVLAVLDDDRRYQRTGARHASTPLLRFTDDTTVPDTLGRWASGAWSLASSADGATRSPLPFGHALYTSGDSERAVLAESHRPHVVVLRPQGRPQMLLRWTEEPRAITDGERRGWLSRREQELSDLVPRSMREALISTPTTSPTP